MVGGGGKEFVLKRWWRDGGRGWMGLGKVAVAGDGVGAGKARAQKLKVILKLRQNRHRSVLKLDTD